MKAKKWLTIITLIVSILSLVIAFLIGKNSNCIYYDISMALLGSAVLGFIMSITEYYVERRKAMEEFWLQAFKVLKELRKVKYLEVDAPFDLIIAAFGDEYLNKWNQIVAVLLEDKRIRHEAKDNLISWYEENITLPFDENTDVDEELEQFYNSKMDGYKKTFIQCMDSYRVASSVELGLLDNAYGNLDFIFANKCVRKEAYDSILDKLRKIIFQFRTETYHFNLLAEGKGNLPVCAQKVSDLNQEYFLLKEEKTNEYTNALIYQDVFDDVDASLEKFRCRIYREKYVEPTRRPISSKTKYFGE